MKISPENEVNPLKWGVGLFIALILLISFCALFVLSDEGLYLPLEITKTIELIGALHPELYYSGHLVEKAQNAILNKLDRYSGLLEPRELDRVNEEFTGSYGGIGITVVGHDRGLMIMSVRDDGPAGQAGIRTGDIIIEADSTELAHLSAYQCTFILRGAENTSIRLLIARNNLADTLEFNLVRKQLPLIHIPYAGLTKHNSLYVKIIDFESGASRDMRNVLDSLYYERPDEVDQIILDLRGNPGGLLREANKIADLFLDKDHLIVGVKGRSIWRNDEFYSTGKDVLNNKPMAVLVDRGSASAAEIVAGALKYANRAVLIGDTTFGKGLVQEYDGFGDGSGLRLTTSRYYFEGGIFLNDPKAEVIDSAAGIPPDYYFMFDEYKTFPTRLENSLLLRSFVSEFQDNIIQYAPLSGANPYWLDRFEKYASDNGFRYQSNITAIAEMTKSLLMLDGYGQNYIDAINRVHNIAQVDDANQFYNYRDYIKHRLYQIALEIKYGTAVAYRDAIVPYRKDIQFAESILLKEPETNQADISVNF